MVTASESVATSAIPAEDLTILRDLKTAIDAKVKPMQGERRSTVQAVAKAIVLNRVADKEVLDSYVDLTGNNSANTTYDEHLKENNLDEKVYNVFFDIYGVYKFNETAQKDSFNKWTQNEFNKLLEEYQKKEIEAVDSIKENLSALNRLSDTTKRQYKDSFDGINFVDKAENYERKFRLYLELVKDNHLDWRIL